MEVLFPYFMDIDMIRHKFLSLIEQHFKIHKVCALLGPRQCGKTTLAKQFAESKAIPLINFFDLNNPEDLQRIEEPLLAFSQLKKYIIIDEVQNKPDLFSVLRYFVDNNDIKILVLGSASRDLIKQSSETLAGRIGYVEMSPFELSETDDINRLWLRGGFPLSYLAENEALSSLWRKDYINTFLERDLPNLGFSIPPAKLRRFWAMVCHYHGGIFNASELGNSLGVSHHTAKNYLDILEGTFMLRSLMPWHENLKKRQVKTPKVYFKDSGIFHSLIGIDDHESLNLHPKLGSSWEGFALEQVIRHYNLENKDCYFWASHNVAEIDLFVFKGGKRLGFEFKYTDSPKITNSMKICLDDLKLDKITVIYPGNIQFKLSDKIEAVGLQTLVG